MTVRTYPQRVKVVMALVNFEGIGHLGQRDQHVLDDMLFFVSTAQVSHGECRCMLTGATQHVGTVHGQV